MWYRNTGETDFEGNPIIEGPAKTVVLRRSDDIPEGLILDDSNYEQYDGMFDGWHYSEEVISEEEVQQLLQEPSGYWNRIQNWFSKLF